MSLRITDTEMTSDEIPNVATKTDRGWVVSGWPAERVFTRNEVITAMTLLEAYAGGKTSEDDPHVASWEAELGL
ncbi:hypothetical protein [Streptosporangium subroseum]|uniref:hypothetical protein n=1 Tax=Streptosporangium subroseum TaxID=106412 RepID=UPI0030915E55|nr:hypothetical protein OHB15_14055 [Streptosporangium subroseum]